MQISNILKADENINIQKPVKQGNLLKLLEEEDDDIPWQVVIRNAPRGLLMFGSRAITDSLPTPDNLAKWGKITGSSCKICKMSPCTLGHILNNCPISLQQGRFTLRHNLILKFLVSKLKDQNLKEYEIYSDLKEHNICGGSIPPHILVSEQKPDIFIINKTKKYCMVIELTCPFDARINIDKARERKLKRYFNLQADLSKNYKCDLITLEICSRGYIDKENCSRLTLICKIFQIKHIRDIIVTLSKLGLIGSKIIYN